MLTDYVRETVEKLDKRAAQRFVDDPPESSDQLHEMLKNAEMELQWLRDPADPNARQSIQSAAKDLAASKGLKIEEPGFPMWEFFDLMRRA